MVDTDDNRESIVRRLRGSRKVLATFGVVCIVLMTVVITGTPVTAQDGGGERPPHWCDLETSTQDPENVSSGYVEVALVNDRSDSMEEGTLFPDLQDATTGFVSRLEDPDEVSEIWFDNNVDVDHSLTTDYQSVIDSINSKSIGTGTEGFPDAVDAAHTDITTSENATEGANKVMIVATDGDPRDFDAQTVLDEGQQAKDDGVRIFVVGFGGSVDEQFAEDLASNESDAYIDPGSSELDNIYEQISGDIEDVGGELCLDVPIYLPHNETGLYTVEAPISGTWTDVTNVSTVTPDNMNALTFHDNGTVVSTDNRSINEKVNVTAEYQGLSGTGNITVANETVDNLGILPPVQRLTASITDGNIQVIIIAAAAGAAASIIATSFAGVAAMTMVMVMGWIAGFVGNGMAMVTVFIALFVGLNVAGNVDYTVSR